MFAARRLLDSSDLTEQVGSTHASFRQVSIGACMHACVPAPLCARVCACVYIYIYIHTYVCLFVCVFFFVCVCVSGKATTTS